VCWYVDVYETVFRATFFWLATTQAGARLKLAQIEAQELMDGLDISLHPELSPSVLISLGLDLEEEQ
jgi:hypothetical protein